ncbi:hypothetical protein GCM10010297_12680 [Streptomyces malachitofuscus]|nr:hypothetical protein GCM10010297_12680 [Streptomyces malachitofuscus]
MPSTCWVRATGPGGRADRVRLGGYEPDSGPTVPTMPHMADEAFAAVGEASTAASI